MDYHVITFWFICFSCLVGLSVMLRRIRAGVLGWLMLYVAILLVSVAGWLGERSWLIDVGALLWLMLVLLPGLLALRYHRLFLQQRYPAARRVARMISWLHPADGWREQPEIALALEMAHRGELPGALEIFKRHQNEESPTALTATTHFYRLTGQWSELLAWHAQHRGQFDLHPQFLHVLMRARGETADLRGLLELYDRHETQIARLDPPIQRDLCRLMLFAFFGRRELVERLFRSQLEILPVASQGYWLATADLAAGQREAARRQFESLLPAADPALRLAIERRLAQLASPSETPLPPDQGLLTRAESEYSQDERFGARPSLFSCQARGTQLLLALNALMFAAEVYFGGATNPETLYQLGAMSPPAVRAGEWWRLVAAIFLHFGPVHLLMNMAGLWVLGPFVEFAFGLRRFVCIHLLSGIGSMGVVMVFASGPNADQFTVGASGCVMGLVGATGALMLCGWLREKALTARRRLILMFSVLAMQTVFDAIVPQVSMAAHLSGAGIGFALGMLLSDRLKTGQSSPVERST